MNGNVAAAGCSSSDSSTSADVIALCGWQLTLDSLDALRSLGHIPVQIVHSESAASLYKVSGLNSEIWWIWGITFVFLIELLLECSH